MRPGPTPLVRTVVPWDFARREVGVPRIADRGTGFAPTTTLRKSIPCGHAPGRSHGCIGSARRPRSVAANQHPLIRHNPRLFPERNYVRARKAQKGQAPSCPAWEMLTVSPFCCGPLRTGRLDPGATFFPVWSRTKETPHRPPAEGSPQSRITRIPTTPTWPEFVHG